MTMAAFPSVRKSQSLLPIERTDLIGITTDRQSHERKRLPHHVPHRYRSFSSVGGALAVLRGAAL
jgi:hypothetical protein